LLSIYWQFWILGLRLSSTCKDSPFAGLTIGSRELKNGISKEPLVKIFIMNSNEWLDDDVYPLSNIQFQKKYLTRKIRLLFSGKFIDHLNFDPNLYCLVTEGGMDEEGTFHHLAEFQDSLIAERPPPSVLEQAELITAEAGAEYW